MTREIIYFGDPMCSWCYGFTDVIQEIRRQYVSRVKVTLIMGGLHPDGTHEVDDRYRNFLRGHWQEVSRATGQPFDLSILDETGWIYDTEKACRAVVAIRRIDPELEWDYFAMAQKGFYQRNHDPNDAESFARIAEALGISQKTFLHTYSDPETMEATQLDFRSARELGVNSFPTVLLRNGARLHPLTVGYRPLPTLVPALEGWLRN